MGNADSHESPAVLAAQCASYQAGIATLRAYVVAEQLVAHNDGRIVVYVASRDVIRLLRCIEADAADAADQCEARPDDTAQHSASASDAPEKLHRQLGRLQHLEAVSSLLLRHLQALGFGDEDAEISGADAVDAINEHFALLRDALAP